MQVAMSTKKAPKLKEIAARIGAYLERFASSWKTAMGRNGVTLYWMTGCRASGRYVLVQYVSYQGPTSLSKAEALRYLEWLDAGNVGRHYDALRAAPLEDKTL